MNYRHQFHAGNAADVFKHVILLVLVRALQRKEKGFLYLDTHAGRGSYDLTVPALASGGRDREPEHPAGIGRLWGRTDLPDSLAAYLTLVEQFNLQFGAPAGELRRYPGSPWIVASAARPQDRLALCEIRPDDAEALAAEFAGEPNVSVHAMDGYVALRAMLPPPERRGLVLVDPPFEERNEFDAIIAGLRGAIRRFPEGVYGIWYPHTERARSERFHESVRDLEIPALGCELEVAGASSGLRMKGCGVVILNPPWRVHEEVRAILQPMARLLASDAGANARDFWIVADR